MTKKKYVVEDDWCTCTDGMIQQGIIVKSQSTVKACARSYNVLHPDEAEQDEKDRLIFLAKRAMMMEDDEKRKAFIEKKGLTEDIGNIINGFAEKRAKNKNKSDFQNFQDGQELKKKLKEKYLGTNFTPFDRSGEQKRKAFIEKKGLTEDIGNIINGFVEKRAENKDKSDFQNFQDGQELEKKLKEKCLGENFTPSDRSGEQVWKLVATERDRFKQNFNCVKLLSAAALIGTLVGAVVCAVMGGALGAGIGFAVGRKLFGPLGGIVGGAVGGIVGTVAGAVLGPLVGSAAATQIAKKAINTFMPCFCYVLTYFSPWSSIHERSFPQVPRALMPDAKVNCLLGGIVSVSVPNMEMAINCAKASMYVYCDKKEDIHLDFDKGASNDFEGDNYGGQTHADFDKYNPIHSGWKQVDPEMGQRIAKKARIKYQEYPMLDKNGNPLRDENGKVIKEYYFYDDKTGTKTGMYITPNGEYVLVSRGTHNSEEEGSGEFWLKDNGGQVGGLSPQYDQDARIGKAVREEIGDDAILITTGHSMAGGKSALAGATGRSNETYSFNAAGVSPLTQARYSVNKADMDHVYSFSSNYDPLTLLSDNVLIAPNIEGKRIVLEVEPTSFADEGFMGFMENGHDLPYLIAAMKKVPFIKVFALHD